MLCGLTCTMLLAIGMASWGSYELWGRECSEDLKQYTLYTCATMVVYQWVIVLGLVMIGSIYITIMGCGSSQERIVINSNGYLIQMNLLMLFVELKKH